MRSQIAWCLILLPAALATAQDRAVGAALGGNNPAAAPAAAIVEVVVVNVRNDHGVVRAALCSASEFLGKHCHYEAIAPAHPGEVTVTFHGIAPGRYAVQAWHDENNNDHIDRDLLGIPLEGVGFSHDPRLLFGPPGFEQSAIDIGLGDTVTRLRLHYFK